MNWLDLLILAVLLISTAMAFHKGALVELFSLGGVIAGFLLAGAHYSALALWVERWGVGAQVSGLIAFLLIALGTMILAGLIGRLLRGTARRVGLGFVDRLLGGIFGLLRGLLLVVVLVIAMAAFVPNAEWLQRSKLVPWFLSAAHGGSHMTPFGFGEKIREGIRMLRAAQPRWLHSMAEFLPHPKSVLFGWK